MTISKVATVVTTAWLKQQFMKGTSGTVSALSNGLRILDTSWLPDQRTDNYNKFFKQCHIETALHFDLWKMTPPSSDPYIGFPIPDSNIFENYVEQLGISNDTHVIAYDQLNSRPSFRTWFLFRLFGHKNISVLSGGLRKWVADGNHTTADEIKVEPGEFDAKFRPELLRDYKFIKENVKSHESQVIDARGLKGYQGGHIPGAKHLAFEAMFNEDGTVKDLLEIKKLFDQAGIDLNRPIIASCGGGIKACTIIAAAEMLGKENVPLYNGSFTEWKGLSDPELIEVSSS